jgi:hypothetical protein
MALTVGEANAVNTVLTFALGIEPVSTGRMLEAMELLADAAHRKLGAGITRDDVEGHILDAIDAGAGD